MLKVPLRAILDPTAAMADATTLKRKRKASKSDPRDAPGAVVHALAHYVLGKASARHTFGNRNYNKTNIRGVVMEKFNSKKDGAKCDQWSLNVRWQVLGYPEGKVVSILREHCTFGEIPEGANPQQNSSSYPDQSLDVRDCPTRGSTTYVPNAMGVTGIESNNASATVGGGGSDGGGKGTSDASIGIAADDTNNGGNGNALGGSDAAPSHNGNEARTEQGDLIQAHGASSQRDAPTRAAATALGSNSSTAQQQQQTSSRAQRRQKHDLAKSPLFVEVNDGKKVPVVSLDPPYIHNGRKWVRADPSFVNGDISESARDIQWHHKTSLGEQVCGANPKFRNMTRLEALLHMFPPNQLDLMLKIVSANLRAKKLLEMTLQELIQWLGVCLLMTRVDMPGRKRDFWGGGKSYSKHIPAPDFKTTGMGRHRFDEIWKAISFSVQPESRPMGMSDSA